MPITNSAPRFGHQIGPWARGPEVTFAAAVLVVFAALAACWRTLPSDLVWPVISTLLFVLGRARCGVLGARFPAKRDHVLGCRRRTHLYRGLRRLADRSGSDGAVG
jgi:hypothetical protein